MMDQTLISEVMQLRSQGLPDSLVTGELTKRGYSPEDISLAISQADVSSVSGGGASSPQSNGITPQSDIYSRFEELAESIIDEKWDDLLAEVRKIMEWKSRVEERQNAIEREQQKLAEDFKTLHLGVLGRLEDYDTRMRDVGIQLNAVGKVFKDVIPQFVDNVKELSAVTKEWKEKKQ
ncbi:MAG: hypothetical protein AABX37_04360 [Nanoarchaeota archaeon]|mgnify:CR=1 FL=1